jgi:hypothetical protein
MGNKLLATPLAVLFLLFSVELRAQVAQVQPKPSPTTAFTPLSSYRLQNYVPGVQYPDWFGSSALPAEVRTYLVGRFNWLEWLKLNDQIDAATAYRIQPVLDALAAVGGAMNPAERLTNASRNAPIKNRDKTQDTTPDSPRYSSELETFRKEMTYYRRRYHIPPTLRPDTSTDHGTSSTSNAAGYNAQRQALINREKADVKGENGCVTAATACNLGCTAPGLACNVACNNAENQCMAPYDSDFKQTTKAVIDLDTQHNGYTPPK